MECEHDHVSDHRGISENVKLTRSQKNNITDSNTPDSNGRINARRGWEKINNIGIRILQREKERLDT